MVHREAERWELDLNVIALRKSEETNKERKGYKYENVTL